MLLSPIGRWNIDHLTHIRLIGLRWYWCYRGYWCITVQCAGNCTTSPLTMISSTTVLVTTLPRTPGQLASSRTTGHIWKCALARAVKVATINVPAREEPTCSRIPCTSSSKSSCIQRHSKKNNFWMVLTFLTEQTPSDSVLTKLTMIAWMNDGPVYLSLHYLGLLATITLTTVQRAAHYTNLTSWLRSSWRRCWSLHHLDPLVIIILTTVQRAGH